MMPTNQLFNITKYYLENEMIRGIKLSDVKKSGVMIFVTAHGNRRDWKSEIKLNQLINILGIDFVECVERK